MSQPYRLPPTSLESKRSASVLALLSDLKINVMIKMGRLLPPGAKET